MGAGTNRNWQRSARYALKGRHVGGVHDMTPEERQAMFSDLGRTASDEEERIERITRIRANRGVAA